MKLDPERVLRPVLEPHAEALGWRLALPLVGAAIVAILAIYRETAHSIVALWGSSDTYAHGYLIVPIALALIWMKRREAAAIEPRPDVVGFVLLAACGLAWLAAEAAYVQVLQHYALAAMIPAVVVALAGRQLAWTIAFPLAFLVLAVPIGEGFVPRLMDWTADFTVAALRFSGIPVYREGTFFAIPSGQWSVAEACSGLRYVTASVTVGALYAYLTYRKWWKRAAFLALAIAVPIFANFLRAYVVVMLGHLSSMKLAVGVDHFVYGWVFFGLVIGLLFWIGAFWRDRPAARRGLLRVDARVPAHPAQLACAALGIAALAAAWPLYARHFERADSMPVSLAAPPAAAGWSLETVPSLQWRPYYEGAAASVLAVYRKGEHRVALYLAHYRNQRQGAELVSSQNLVAGRDPSASVLESRSQSVALGSAEVDVRQSRVRWAGDRLLVWDWYRIGERHLGNPYLAKALLARDRLIGRGDESAAIVLAAPYDARPDAAVETLRVFVHDMQVPIETALVRHGSVR